MLRVLLIIALASLTLSGMAPSQTAKKPGHYLLVWAGDQAKTGQRFPARDGRRSGLTELWQIGDQRRYRPEKYEGPSYRI